LYTSPSTFDLHLKSAAAAIDTGATISLVLIG
jgi:hypothetical protein